MSNSEVTARLNSICENYYGAKAVIEGELKAISTALERIRTSSHLQNELTEHLLAVHRRCRCKAYHNPTQDTGTGPGRGGGGQLAISSCSPGDSAVPDPVDSAFKRLTEIVNGLHNAGDTGDAKDDISGPSIPVSMISHMEAEEVLSDVNRTLEASAEEGVSTTVIKVETQLEDDQFPDMLLRLEKDHGNADMESNNMENIQSHSCHEEEHSSHHVESDGPSHLKLTNTVVNTVVNTVSNTVLGTVARSVVSEVSDLPADKQEGDSSDYCSLDMDGNSMKAMSNLGPHEETLLEKFDGTNNTEQVPDDHIPVGVDSNEKDQGASTSEDGTNKTEQVPDGHIPVGVDSNKNDQGASRSDVSDRMASRAVGPRKGIPPIQLALPPVKAKKNGKECVKNYRARQKENPELYRLFRTNETLRIQEYRHCRQSEDAKERNRVLQRERQRRYRQRKKDHSQPANTRKSCEKQRERWREQQRECRRKMNRQKRNAVNQKRRLVYRMKKEKEKKQSQETEELLSSPWQSPSGTAIYAPAIFTQVVTTAATSTLANVPTLTSFSSDVEEYVLAASADVDTSHQAASIDSNVPALAKSTDADAYSVISTKDVSSHIPPVSTPAYTYGDYVLVNFSTSSRTSKSEDFIGMVLSIDEDAEEIEVMFMRKHDSYYIWPDIQDRAWVPSSTILARLQPPSIYRGRHNFASLTEETVV